jgi:thiol-disulfide isomerase/thioredoxin
MKTRMTSYLSGALAMLLAGSAIAARLPFNQAQYEQAVAAGKPVVVYFHADWCPTCRAQQPIVDKLLGEPQFMSVTLFEADFDTETALEKSLKVTQQSTFVVFKLGHEATRSTGQTQEPAIRAVLQKAL